MSGETRWVLVDDEDPNITWSGSWERTTERFDDPTIGGSGFNRFGPPKYGSQHVTNSTGGMTFTFEGSQFRVGGTSDVRSTEVGILDPQWNCTVDGESYPARPGPIGRHPLNKWVFCDMTTFPLRTTGAHTFTLSAQSDERPLYVDFIEYKPYSRVGESMLPARVKIHENDPAVRYSPGWTNTDGRMTRQNGAKLRVDFNGTKATWVGWIVVQSGSGPSSGSYSVDGGPNTRFIIPTAPRGIAGPALYYQTFFETASLPRGPHHVIVTFEGTPADTPLTFDKFIIEDGDIFATDASEISPGDPFAEPQRSLAPQPSESPSESETANPDSDPDSEQPVGAIIGGVLGGVALIVIIWLLVWWWWRRRRRRNNNPSANTDAVGEVPPQDLNQITHTPMANGHVPVPVSFPPPQPAPATHSPYPYDIRLLSPDALAMIFDQNQQQQQPQQEVINRAPAANGFYAPAAPLTAGALLPYSGPVASQQQTQFVFSGNNGGMDPDTEAAAVAAGLWNRDRLDEQPRVYV